MNKNKNEKDLKVEHKDKRRLNTLEYVLVQDKTPNVT